MTDADWRKQKARELWPQADAHRTDIERALLEAAERERAACLEIAHGNVEDRCLVSDVWHACGHGVATRDSILARDSEPETGVAE
jgi:hypothetical protein